MTITELSKKYGLSADTLRYYEKVGLFKNIKRNKRGQRDYQKEDEERLEFILCMRHAGLSIDVLKQYLDLLEKGNSTIVQRKELLVKQREVVEQRLHKDQEALNKLNYKINRCEQMIKNISKINNI